MGTGFTDGAATGYQKTFSTGLDSSRSKGTTNLHPSDEKLFTIRHETTNYCPFYSLSLLRLDPFENTWWCKKYLQINTKTFSIPFHYYGYHGWLISGSKHDSLSVFRLIFHKIAVFHIVVKQDSE